MARSASNPCQWLAKWVSYLAIAMGLLLAGLASGVPVQASTLSPVPTVTSLSPAGGPPTGGTGVTIMGTGFGVATAVYFGGTVATSFTVQSSTEITANAPAAGIGVVDVTVVTPGGTSTTGVADQFAYVSMPLVSDISPNGGSTAGGTAVTITGSNLTGAKAVYFGGTAATSFMVQSSHEITAIAPSGSIGVVDVTVTTVGGTSPKVTTDQLTYITAPTVTSLVPASGPPTGGTSVTILGSNFTGATRVSFGGAAASSFKVNSSTWITATVPAESAGFVDVTVTTPGGTSGTGIADRYAYMESSPVVTSLSPTIGLTTGGTSVTINGSNFTGASEVSFGGVEAKGFTINSPTQITAIAPAERTGTVYVTVTTTGGTSLTGGAEQFTYRVIPVVTSISPNNGLAAGGTSVTITGSNFTGATRVSFSGTAATNFTVSSSSQITATSPAESAGTAYITVTTAEGTSQTGSGNQFTYVDPNAAPSSYTGSATVNPKVGGIVGLGGIAVAIPAGALQGSEVNVDLQAVSSPPTAPLGLKLLGTAYRLMVNGQDRYTFNRPVTLVFTLDPSQLASDHPTVYYYDDINDQWVNMGGMVVGGTLTVTAQPFSEYAVMYQPTQSPLSDIGGNWAETDIEKLVAAGGITGYADGTFQPNAKITRAEFVALLVRAFKLAPKTGRVFGDTKDCWAQGYISTAVADGIVDGYDPFSFGPNEPITREQMATMLVRAANLDSVSGAVWLAFTDASLIDPWARFAVETAVKDGLVQGYPDGAFRPLGDATRAEAVTMIVRIMK